MTRTELITMISNAKSVKSERLAKCSAYTILAELDNGRAVDILQSYETRVAVFSRRTGTVYAFDYYSQTTTQHIYKFSKLLRADRITWLYDRSNHVIETNLCGGNSFRASKKVRENLVKCDYSCEIENFLK